jgi:hypothetical protein
VIDMAAARQSKHRHVFFEKADRRPGFAAREIVRRLQQERDLTNQKSARLD